MPSRLVDDKKRYLYSVYIGKKPETFWGKVRWYITAPLRKWNLAKLECMDEGEILREYYALTRRDDDGDHIISISEKTL